MNRKTFSLVTSLAILSSSLSPTWAAGKDFTYNNLNQNLPIKAQLDEIEVVEEKIDLPLVTETMPDESVRNKYVKIIFVPEIKTVNGLIQYGELIDVDGNIIPINKNSSEEEKSKSFYVLSSARWSDILNYKEDGKLILPKLAVENNESNPEKKEIHKFLGWSLRNDLIDPFNLKKYKKVSDIRKGDTLEFRSRFETLPYFYRTEENLAYDSDGYRIIDFSKKYNRNKFISYSDLSGWKGQLSLNEDQREFADPEAFTSKKIYFYFKKNSGDYNFGDYKPSIVKEKDNTLWYWHYGSAYENIAWDSFELSDKVEEYKAICIHKFFRISDEIDLNKLPLPEGIYVVKLQAEDGYTVKDLDYSRHAVRDGVSLAEVKSIASKPKLIDKDKVQYYGEVAWYDGYKKIDKPSEFKINSDTVLTARRVIDFQSEKFTPEVNEIKVNKDEDVTIKKLKEGITNLPKDIKDLEIVENVNTSEVGEGKATLKLTFTDTSSKEVEVPVKVINVIDAGLVTPVPEIKAEDIIKEEVPYNGTINLLDNIKNLPDGVRVEDLSEKINTKISGTYTGRVKVTFKDESSRIVEIPIEVSEALSDSYTPQVKKIEVNKNEDVTLEKLKKGITNLPKNLDKIEIKTYPDTSEVGEGKATLKLIFTDTSSKEVEVPVKVINVIDANLITPVPEIKAEDIIKEEIPYNGEINLLDNIENLPDGAKVEDIIDPIDTKSPGTYTGKVKVTFKDGSSRIVEIPIEVLEALASSYTPEIKAIEVNKGEDVTLEKLKSGIVNLPKNLDKIEIITYPDTSEVGEGKATLKLIFTDTSSKEVEIPVKVINIIDAGIVTPVPEIKVEDIIKEEVPYNGQINLLDNIKNLPKGAEVKDLSEPIDTRSPGSYTGKIKVTFKDGSSRILEIPVKVQEALASSYTPEIKTIEVNKDQDVTLEKLKSGITNLPKDIKNLEIVENVNTSEVGEGKATLKLIFLDTSSKEVEIPVKVINVIDGGLITPVPEIKAEDIIKEEVPYNGEINLRDNIENLPNGAEVEDISEPIDTKRPGTYTGKVRVIFKDGSSRILEIPIIVLEALADSYTAEVKEIEVNKGEDVTRERLKEGITNLPKNIKVIEIKENVNTSEVGESKAVLELIFSDTSKKEVEVPVKVIEKISGGTITPIPTINESDIITEEVPYNGEINLLDNIKNSPDGAKVEDIIDPIDTKSPGTYTGKVKVTFKDGSSRIVEIPIEVLEALASSYTPEIKAIEVNKGEDVTLEKLKSGIVNLPKNLDKIEIITYPDTSEVGEGKGTLKLIFTDKSSKEVEVPVKVINVIDAGLVTPVPEIKAEDIIKEEVLYNGQINLLDNIENLQDGAEVENISEPIDTKNPGSYTGKVKVTFKDGSSRILEIPIEVLIPMAEKYPVQNSNKTEVENLESLNSLEKSEIEEKVREANPQVASIEVDHRGNVTLIYEDGSTNTIKAEYIVVLKEKLPEEEVPEDKPGEEGEKDPEDKPGEEGEKDPEDKQGEEGEKDPEDKLGEEGEKDPEDKPGEEGDKDPEDTEEESEEKESSQDSKEEEKNYKENENKLYPRDEFPRYYVRSHRTPTYMVETRIDHKASKPKVSSKKFVIDTKTGTYTVTEDGKTLEKNMEVKPVIKGGRTNLPLRALAEILDAKVIWNEGTRTASFTRDGLTAFIQIDGKKIVLSNGETIELESKALNINGRIYLPLVNVGQVFGLTSGNSLDGDDQDIEWDDKDKTVTINIK